MVLVLFVVISAFASYECLSEVFFKLTLIIVLPCKIFLTGNTYCKVYHLIHKDFKQIS
jgi:hypothetical protein